MLRVAWQFWKDYAERVADYQAKVVLTLIYIVVVGPVWAVGRITGHKFLPLKPAKAASLWYEAEMGSASDIASLKQQS